MWPCMYIHLPQCISYCLGGSGVTHPLTSCKRPGYVISHQRLRSHYLDSGLDILWNGWVPILLMDGSNEGCNSTDLSCHTDPSEVATNTNTAYYHI